MKTPPTTSIIRPLRRESKYMLNTSQIGHYFGRERQETVFSRVVRHAPTLRKHGTDYEVALRVRPALKWDNEAAEKELLRLGLLYRGTTPPPEVPPVFLNRPTRSRSNPAQLGKMHTGV